MEAKGFYRENCTNITREAILKKLNAMTREHARVMLPWNKTLPAAHAGLKQQSVREDVLRDYRSLLKLRRSDKVFAYGAFELISAKKNAFVYRRSLDGSRYVIEANLAREGRKSLYDGRNARLVYDSLPLRDGSMDPYAVRIWKEQ